MFSPGQVCAVCEHQSLLGLHIESLVWRNEHREAAAEQAADFLKAFHKLTQLESATLPECRHQAGVVEVFTNPLSNIKAVRVMPPSLDDESFGEYMDNVIKPLVECKGIVDLDLSRYEWLFSGDVAAIAKQSHLQHLMIDNSRLSDANDYIALAQCGIAQVYLTRDPDLSGKSPFVSSIPGRAPIRTIPQFGTRFNFYRLGR